MEEIIGKRFNSDTTATRDEDGVWTVTMTFTESRSLDGINWEANSIEVKSLDNVLDSAYDTALRGLQAKFKDAAFNGSLFSN